MDVWKLLYFASPCTWFKINQLRPIYGRASERRRGGGDSGTRPYMVIPDVPFMSTSRACIIERFAFQSIKEYPDVGNVNITSYDISAPRHQIPYNLVLVVQAALHTFTEGIGTIVCQSHRGADCALIPSKSITLLLMN